MTNPVQLVAVPERDLAGRNPRPRPYCRPYRSAALVERLETLLERTLYVFVPHDTRNQQLAHMGLGVDRPVKSPPAFLSSITAETPLAQ